MATRRLLEDLLVGNVLGSTEVTLESVAGIDAARLVESGEQIDLVFLAHDALQRLAGAGHVHAATLTPLMISHVAVATSSESREIAETDRSPAYQDAAEVRTALRAARRIGYSTGPSGDALLRFIEEWGMTAELSERLVQSRPGVPVAKALAAKDIDLGFQQVSELVGHRGVRVLGLMPADCAIVTVFAGAVAKSSDRMAVAKDVLGALVSDESAAIVRKHGFLPAW